MATKGDLDTVSILGRPIKPVALGLTILMVTLTVSNVTGAGVLGDVALSRVLAAGAAVSAILLTAGWVTGKQGLAEAGLLATAAGNIARSSFLMMTYGPGQQSVWLSMGVTVIAAGAYLLETWDASGRTTTDD